MSTQPQLELVSDSAAQVCNVAILGFGTVGRAVAEILSHQRPSHLRLTHIYNRNVGSKKVSWVAPQVRWSDRIEDVLASDVDVIVEVAGGLDPAADWVRRALRSGKSVVTANKQLIARCGPELQRLASVHGQRLEFGASVAGGIPVLLGIQNGLAGDQIFNVSGILNGTCNYILSRMESSGLTFDAALAEAQQFGYAEADPTADVDGYDARAKLAILSRVGLHAEVDADEIATESITPVEAIDFHYASQLQCTIRQISRAEVNPRHLCACVGPALVPLHSALARAQGNQNVVVATGKYGGETVFAGHGAGGHPTAVAVVSDLLTIARAKKASVRPHGRSIELPISSDFTAPHYVRFVVKDRPGIIAHIATAFARHGINIDAVLQKSGFTKPRLPFVVTLEACGRPVVREALLEIEKADFNVEPPLSLPILN